MDLKTSTIPTNKQKRLLLTYLYDNKDHQGVVYFENLPEPLNTKLSNLKMIMDSLVAINEIAIMDVPYQDNLNYAIFLRPRGVDSFMNGKYNSWFSKNWIIVIPILLGIIYFAIEIIIWYMTTEPK